jgi:hypothetical protein
VSPSPRWSARGSSSAASSSWCARTSQPEAGRIALTATNAPVTAINPAATR